MVGDDLFVTQSGRLQQGIDSPLNALIIGLLLGLLLAVGSAWAASRSAAGRQRERFQPELDGLTTRLEEARSALAAAEQHNAVLETRIARAYFRRAFTEAFRPQHEADRRLAQAVGREAQRIQKHR